ncbi:MAG: 2-succinyl-5-enolpyruvyl-6-hydroxy-3-cyclohexene-1-carboxylic-acid synthase [Solirubrobacterales bacterium]|nr:2-succinyl-5-enolpyruvyl-6-hydroxy-3-cyclohexene-1-carboxylic-acid synthase [Solirubrobacterales bacterium]
MIDATNRNTALASALVDELRRAGAQSAVIAPGSRSSPLALALDREAGIDLRVVLDERSAGFVALGLALSTGRPAIVACTSGSAAANLHPAVVEADQAGVPLIVLTSDRPPELREIGAGQTIDQVGLYGSHVRWFHEVGTHEADEAGILHMRSTGSRAIAEAILGRGPVHLNLSWRDPLGPEPRAGDVTAVSRTALEGRSGGRPLTTGLSGREPSEGLATALAEAISGADRGLIVAGRIADRSLARPISALAAATGFPVLADITSQLRFGSHDRSPVVAAYDLILRHEAPDLTPDFVIRFGDMPTSKALRGWLTATGADQIVVDPAGRWNEPTRVAGAFVRAEPAATIAAVLPRLTSDPAGAGGWLSRWTGSEQAAQEAIDSVLADGSLSEPAVQRLLATTYGEGDRVLIASSMPIRDAEAFAAGSEAEVTVHSNRGANGIDGLPSTAAGIAAGSGAPTWLVLGDLAFAHDLGGLAAVAATDAPVRIVVIDNGGGGIFDFLPQAGQVDPERFAALFTTPSQMDVGAAARAFGIEYVEVRDADGLTGLAAATESVIAHVPLDRSGNVALHGEVASAVAGALG